MRELAKRRDDLRKANPNAKITVIVDNMLYASEVTDPIVWDDANERLYILKINEDHRDSRRPFKIQTIDYDIVICLEIDTDRDSIYETAVSCGFDKDTVNDFITKLTTIKL